MVLLVLVVHVVHLILVNIKSSGSCVLVALYILLAVVFLGGWNSSYSIMV